MTIFWLAVITAVALLVGGAFFLWLGARVFGVPRVGLLRAAVVALLVDAAGVALLVAAMRLAGWWTDRAVLSAARVSAVNLGAVVVAMLLSFAAAWLLVGVIFRTGAKRSLVINLFAAAATSVIVLVAFVPWALLAVETYNVPTGAMAPTIYGDHADVSCSNCGWPYAVSLSSWHVDPEATPIVSACPMCGQEQELGADTWMVAGDRILVDATARPVRWDLCVFHPPAEALAPRAHGGRGDLYVKRLVGLPGERIEIHRGDLFADGKRLSKPPGVAEDLWIPVCDTKYTAKETLADSLWWEPQQDAPGWRMEQGKWEFQNPAEGRLALNGVITDRLAYNGQSILLGGGNWNVGLPNLVPPALVGDVKVQCVIESLSGDGELRFHWAFDGREAIASVSPGGQLELRVGGRPASGDGADEDGVWQSRRGKLDHRLRAGDRLVLSVRDGVAYLITNGRPRLRLPVAGEGVTDLAEDPPVGGACRLVLSARDCRVALGRIRVFRDIHYLSLDELQPGLKGEAACWPFGRGATLGEDEYFLLGDNPQKSKDARFWGPVAKHALLGVARGRYWPPCRWHMFH